MECAAILRDGSRCPNPIESHEVCLKHLKWTLDEGGQLGFNLIVKNEESELEACLKSIRPIADEIVVTDTGSTDGTIDIALKYADKVLFHEWTDDFSGARNYSLQFSRARWIGWIDADETLIEAHKQELLDLVYYKANGSYAMFCPLLSSLPDGRVSKHYLPKFFRRDTAHFEAIVHNQLVHKGPVLTTDVAFWHTGYNLSEEIMSFKRRRTMKLLRVQLAEAPEDAFATMNLARTLMTEGKHTESLELAQQGIKLSGAILACREMLLYNIAVCSANLSDYGIALNACWDCLAMNPKNLDMVFLLGWISVKRAEWAKAIQFFQRYKQCRQQQEKDGFNLLILDFWNAQAQVNNFLCIAYQHLDLYDESLLVQRRAVVESPYNVGYWKNLIAVSEKAGSRFEAEQALFATVERGIADRDIIGNLAVLQNRAA